MRMAFSAVTNIILVDCLESFFFLLFFIDFLLVNMSLHNNGIIIFH